MESNTSKKVMIATAVAGLITFGAAMTSTVAIAAGKGTAYKCMGGNACKGKGTCGMKGKHACAGQNGCKGKGYVMTKDKAACDKLTEKSDS